MAVELSWADVHAFRLERHHLTARAPRAQLAKVVGDIGGVQAQVMSFAELQIAVRVDCTPEDVREALWKRKTLVKTWLMRGTLHLARSSDLPIYTGALGAYTLRSLSTWLKYLKLTEPQLMSLFDRIDAALNGTPMTREELIAAVGRGQPGNVQAILRSGWGGILKPAARRGRLCFGPNRGQSVTFVRPEEWLQEWHPLEREAATAELARRYLRAYGPATRKDFARWMGNFPGADRAAWTALQNELIDVSVEGTHAQLLAADLKAMRARTGEASVQLLPGFDPYLMGHASRDHLFDKAHRWKVSRVSGWISPVLLVNGEVLGVWTHSVSKGRLRVDITPFAAVKPRIVRGAGARAEAIAEALGTKLDRLTVN
ncbi:MAG TPA: winged helix DNA-binding domain-containing protein [Candidatus Dormibacteraeota bacterium]|nr:winged helix DNA-binding domain-containing protein [Candidatus Dormibacteraeota bacterium]